ncbi:Pentatricopeptide repeat [Trema orientale]|uniref:Pentatricopeptide repeat n=1 Tax=Trema orientale TaxID=63057 RepID=A0A2P5FG10_TREOI|nr:Pentatricopeptide repeat [Trema orientale]
MALTTHPFSPSKTPTVITTISEFPHNPKTLILQQCKSIRDLNQVHAHLIKTRLLHRPAVAENVLESAAILLPGAMDYALSIFRRIDRPDSAAYNVMIRGLIYKKSNPEAILMFKKMCENSVQPDEFTFTSVLKACSRLGTLHEGYAKNERWDGVVKLFRKMLESGFECDEVTMISVLPACGRVGDLELGKWISEYIEANGLKGNLTLITSLVDIIFLGTGD